MDVFSLQEKQLKVPKKLIFSKNTDLTVNIYMKTKKLKKLTNWMISKDIEWHVCHWLTITHKKNVPSYIKTGF